MRAVRSLVAAGSALAAGGTLLAAVNQRHIRRPAQPTSAIAERVSVLLPMRDEAPRADQCLRAVLAQRALTDLEVIVIDDGSTDNTADIVASVMKQFPAVNARLIRAENQTPPEGWIGKPWACERLSKAATGSVFVFVDADVTLPVTMNRIALEQQGVGLGVAQIVDADQFQIMVGAREDGARHQAADTSETVNCYLRCHCTSLP
jgi:hypothetical protein